MHTTATNLSTVTNIFICCLLLSHSRYLSTRAFRLHTEQEIWLPVPTTIYSQESDPLRYVLSAHFGVIGSILHIKNEELLLFEHSGFHVIFVLRFDNFYNLSVHLDVDFPLDPFLFVNTIVSISEGQQFQFRMPHARFGDASTRPYNWNCINFPSFQAFGV